MAGLRARPESRLRHLTAGRTAGLAATPVGQQAGAAPEVQQEPARIRRNREEISRIYNLGERDSGTLLLIDAAGAKQAAPEFADRVTLRWQMPEHTEGPLLEQLRELTRGGAEAAVSEPFYAPF